MAELDLTGIGDSAALFDTRGTGPLSKFLIDWMNERIVEMKGELREDGRVATGSLEQSLAIEAQRAVSDIDMQILANDYWDFINSGVDGIKNSWGSPYSFKTLNPSAKMVQSMKESKWAATKGLFPNEGQTFDQMLYAIAAGVKRQGIKPSHFMDAVMTDSAIDQFTENLADQFATAIAELTFANIEQ